MRKLFLLLMIISLSSPTLAKDEVKWDSFEDCVDGASDHCRNKCDDEVGLDAVDCALEDLPDKVIESITNELGGFEPAIAIKLARRLSRKKDQV